jgi:Helix-turn-helix domain
MRRSGCQLDYVQHVNFIRSSMGADRIRALQGYLSMTAQFHRISVRNTLDSQTNDDVYVYLIQLTQMLKSKSSSAVDQKAEVLRQQGVLHPHPEVVQDEAFGRDDFFDPRDRVQVRYEMLRRHRVDKQPVTEVSAAFGLSRQAFYTTEATFEDQGIVGLLPRQRGPRRAHKCTDEILDFAEQWRADPATAGEDVSEAIRKRFAVSINPRSIDRALARRKKKR